MGKLAALSVKNVSKSGRYGDGDGVYLHVAAPGTKSWVQRIVIYGNRRDIGLGSYSTVSLAQARSLASSNRSSVSEGRDPLAEKRHAKDVARNPTSSVPTLAEAAARVIEIRRPTWSNTKPAAQWSSTLGTYAFPTIVDKAIDTISAADVLSTLTPIWTCKPETANRVRQRIEAVLDWSVTNGWRSDNPAGRALLRVLPDTKGLKEHHRTLPYQDVASALRKVRLSPSHTLTRAAFEFLVLTAARSGEVRGTEWSEIDWEQATWTVPAARMKAKREHRIPLSERALSLLRDAWTLSGSGGLVFPAPRGGALSDMAFNVMLKRLKVPAVPHGFRSSFRDWTAEKSGVGWAVAENALAHNVGNATERAYLRSDVFEERRGLMQDWADYIAS